MMDDESNKNKKQNRRNSVCVEFCVRISRREINYTVQCAHSGNKNGQKLLNLKFLSLFYRYLKQPHQKKKRNYEEASVFPVESLSGKYNM